MCILFTIKGHSWSSFGCGGASFVDAFCYLCFMFLFGMLSCLFLAALLLPAGKGLTSWISCLLCFLVFGHFHIWCSGSGMLLDGINSRSLFSSLP